MEVVVLSVAEKEEASEDVQKGYRDPLASGLPRSSWVLLCSSMATYVLTHRRRPLAHVPVLIPAQEASRLWLRR